MILHVSILTVLLCYTMMFYYVIIVVCSRTSSNDPMICNLSRELVCIKVKWTWYNGRDKFFHITSGRINTWKGVNQLKELFFLNIIIFFLNTYTNV